MQRVLDLAPGEAAIAEAMRRVSGFPRLRYMGSKYRVVPHLLKVFTQLDGSSALDAFSGSGVISYALKALGKDTVANDFLHFSSSVARATVQNSRAVLTSEDIDRITGPAADDRDFIQSTFDGLYFPSEDHAFLDSAWSHIDRMRGGRRDIAISALCLAAARKQPRGVFTITDFRYDDGRKNLRLPLRDQFRSTAEAYNQVVFENGTTCKAICGDVFDIDPRGYDLVYLDPPYTPPRDDNCYIKRYHFLEGLSVYWRGQSIMEDTNTKKLEKRFTPFSYKDRIRPALTELFERFRDSTIVLSYSSNSVPDEEEMLKLLKSVKRKVKVHRIPHRYHFGTHSSARRREAEEYIFVAP